MTLRELIQGCDNIGNGDALQILVGNKIIDYLLCHQILDNPNMMVLDVEIDHFEICISRKGIMLCHRVWIKNNKEVESTSFIIKSFLVMLFD